MDIFGLALLVSLFFAAFIAATSVYSVRAEEDASNLVNNSGWAPVFAENFESGIGSSWTVADKNEATGGEYYWATNTFTATEFITYFPVILNLEDPPYYYFDDFSDSNSGWPIVDNTWNPKDCFKWYYHQGETYRADICDDRTDVKVSPLVDLPTGNYEIEVDARFREAGGWWTSYGILFDAKDDPNPSKPDLGDYYMIWVLWEGNSKHKWKILEDIPGDQKDVTSWSILDSSVYNYGGGTAWNTWKIVRTDTTISVYVNGNHLRTVNEKRPTTNYQTLFGLYTSTYETDRVRTGFDNYLVKDASGNGSVWEGTARGTYVKSDFSSGLERLLPEFPAAPVPAGE